MDSILNSPEGYHFCVKFVNRFFMIYFDYLKNILFKITNLCEGTRFTDEKHAASMEIAKSKGLPLLKHHLLPRTKGFTLLTSITKNKSNF